MERARGVMQGVRGDKGKVTAGRDDQEGLRRRWASGRVLKGCLQRKERRTLWVEEAR